MNRASRSGSRMRSQPATIRSQAVTVTGVVLVEARRGVGGGAAQHPAPAVGERVGHHVGRVPPDQAVLLQVEVADDRAGGGERVERAEQVGDEAGRHALALRTAPPTSSCASTSTTSHPASASALAATRPFGPAPTTTASQVVTGIGTPRRRRWPLSWASSVPAVGRRSPGQRRTLTTHPVAAPRAFGPRCCRVGRTPTPRPVRPRACRPRSTEESTCPRTRSSC